VADTPEEFAAAVVKLLREPDLPRTLAANGKVFIHENFSLESVRERLERVYGDVAGLKTVSREK
jgi:glycosyltransferase involved in cell wall biosynthesis